MKNHELATMIVEAIADNVNDRSGIKWSELDEGVQSELIQSVEQTVMELLDRNYAGQVALKAARRALFDRSVQLEEARVDLEILRGKYGEVLSSLHKHRDHLEIVLSDKKKLHDKERDVNQLLVDNNWVMSEACYMAIKKSATGETCDECGSPMNPGGGEIDEIVVINDLKQAVIFSPTQHHEECGLRIVVDSFMHVAQRARQF